MSSLSSYDSEAIGFESVTQTKRTETHSSTQTTEFYESGVSTQTAMTKDCGSSTNEESTAVAPLPDYPPPGLNEFLRKITPAVLEQLKLGERHRTVVSDSDDEELITGKLYQEINLDSAKDVQSAGDHTPAAILDLSWSGAGNSIAISLGRTHHDEWCLHEGLIRVYTIKQSEGDKLCQPYDIKENSCVSVLEYHPSVAGLLAYGTVAGEIVVYNLRNINISEGTMLKAPAESHDSKRISFIHWPRQDLASCLLMLKTGGKRRGATDQVLVTAGSDGKVNVWQVNPNLSVFQNVISYQLNGSKKMAAVDITCFGFANASTDFNVRFVVGAKSGEIFLCKTTACQTIADSDCLDPVYDELDGHDTCVLNICPSVQNPMLFASISMDSELRIYDINHKSPLKVINLEEPISHMIWLPNTNLFILGLAEIEKKGSMLKLCSVATEKTLSIDGLNRNDENYKVSVTAMDIQNGSICRVATGDSAGVVRIWDIPIRKIKSLQRNVLY